MVAATAVIKIKDDATSALVDLGIPKTKAAAAVQRATSRLQTSASLEEVIKASLAEVNGANPLAMGQPPMRKARFAIGQVVKHRIYPFRGVIFDVDPVFANTEEWLASIPEEVRPRRDQPFYHLLAENAQTTYVAYVSEQNLLPDETGKPVSHPQVPHFFKELRLGHYVSRDRALH
jgi:heat shock protein HspQ